jgi:hypothetical protein
LGQLARHVCLLGAVALVAIAGRPDVACAQAPPRAAQRVVLVSPGAELESAARTALEPWAVEILVVSAASPGATAPRANETARALALAHRAGAVVWVSQHEQGHAVWVYDLETDQVVSRPLAGSPPFDGPAAAAAALSVKTLLRHSATAPEAERYGAAGPNDAVEQRSGTNGQAQRAAPDDAAAHAAEQQRSSTDAQVRRAVPFSDATTDRTVDEGASPEHMHARSWLDLEVAGGLRFGLARSRSSGEPRFGAAVAWWPGKEWLGVSFRAAMGTGVEIAAQSLHGRLFDATTVAAGRMRYAPLYWLQLSAAAGAGVHFTVLQGRLAIDGHQAHALRVVPSLDLELWTDWLVSSWFRIGLRGGLSWLLRPQRYLVRAEPVLELSRAAFEAGLTAGLTLPD